MLRHFWINLLSFCHLPSYLYSCGLWILIPYALVLPLCMTSMSNSWRNSQAILIGTHNFYLILALRLLKISLLFSLVFRFRSHIRRSLYSNDNSFFSLILLTWILLVRIILAPILFSQSFLLPWWVSAIFILLVAHTVISFLLVNLIYEY